MFRLKKVYSEEEAYHFLFHAKWWERMILRVWGVLQRIREAFWWVVKGR